jgi:cell wall-associated NlpC family hydrolase
VRLSRVVWGIASRAHSRQATLVLVVALAAFLGAASALAEPPQISAKRAEAQRVLDEIHSLDVQLEKAIEAYNGATDQLAAIERARALNTRHYVIAKSNLKVAQRRLASRLRAIYTSDQEDSTLAILLGSRSLTDFLNRVETVNSVASQDSQVLGEIRRFKHDVAVRGVQLKQAHIRQEQIVSQRAAAKHEVESGLAERQRLLGSIKGEIAQLQAEEARRQEQLRIAAEARLRAQLTAQRQAAAEAQQTDVVGASAVTPEGITVAPPSRYGGVVGIAMQYLGTPYVWGGASPGGFDCSGFVMFVFAQVGVSLPHHAADQFNYGTPVSNDQLEPGDLVFFDGLGHVGIYIGGGQFIHAPHTGDVVKISSMSDSWYAATFVGARRIT